MTREQAGATLAAFGQSVGLPRLALNANGIAGAMVGKVQLYFEHHPEGTLECSALVYRFRRAPRPGVIEAFRAEQAAGTPTGGGDVDYEPENKGLYLTRLYSEAVPPAAFLEQMQALGAASLAWSGPVFDKVMAAAGREPGRD